MKKTFFLSFLFLILLLISCSIVISVTDWRTYRFDTMHDAVTEETFSRFDLGVNTLKSFAFGSNYQPLVIETDVNQTETGGVNTYLILAGSDGLLRIYDNTLTNINSTTHVITGEMHVTDFFIDGKIDIFILEKNGVLDTDNFTWLQFDGSTITTEYTEDFGNTSLGINCIYPYCVFTTGEIRNQTTLLRFNVFTNTMTTLNVGTDGIHMSDRGCNHIPVLRDIDYDGNLEAIFCADVIGNTDYDIINVDVTNLVMKNSFSNDGILEDLLGGTNNLDAILVNVDGSDDTNFEIITAFDEEIFIHSVAGVERLHVDVASYCAGEIKSLSRTDIDGDSKYDILYYCSSGASGITLGAIPISGGMLLYNDMGTCTAQPTGQMVMTDLTNEAIHITLNSTVTPCGMYKITTSEFNLVLAENIFNATGFETTNPIVADITGNNLYEVIYSKNGNTTIYSASYTNQPVNFFGYEIDTGTPVCANSLVTFRCYGVDNEGEEINCGIDVYNNGTIEWGSFTNIQPYVTHLFTHDDMGYDFDNMEIYMSDAGHPYNEEVSRIILKTYQVVSENSTFCYGSGEGGTTGGNVTDVGIQAEAVEELGNIICDSLGVCTTKSKAFLFLVLLIMITVCTAQATKGNTVVIIIVDFAFMIVSALPGIELIPTWVGLLIVLLAVGFAVQMGKGYFGGGGDGK